MRNRKKAYREGFWSERLAALLLFLKGYRILKIRYKTPMGEIDIVAQRGKVLAAVEVKQRKDPGTALGAISPASQVRIENALRHYVAHHPQYQNYSLRFDVVAACGLFHFQHLDNAWQART